LIQKEIKGREFVIFKKLEPSYFLFFMNYIGTTKSKKLNKDSTCSVWDRTNVHEAIWSGKLKERGNWDDLNVNRRIVKFQ